MPAVYWVCVFSTLISPQFVVSMNHEVFGVQERAIVCESKESVCHPITVHPFAVAIVASAVSAPQLPDTVIVAVSTVPSAV